MVPDRDDTLPPRARVATDPAADLDDTVLRGTAATQTPPEPMPALPEPAAPPLRFRVVDAGRASDPVPLDQTVYLGRRPRAPRVVSTPVRLITVPSAAGGVSATHLKLEQVGQVVVATDLKSTNGTVVNAPGSPARRLHPGESLVVTTGTQLQLAGEPVVIEILSRPRLG